MLHWFEVNGTTYLLSGGDGETVEKILRHLAVARVESKRMHLPMPATLDECTLPDSLVGDAA